MALGEVLRDEGIARAEMGAAPAWIATACDAVRAVARRCGTFTTDDVWGELARVGAPTIAEPRAMGAVMRKMCVAGVVVGTGSVMHSTRPEQHRRPLTVWRSLVRSV